GSVRSTAMSSPTGTTTGPTVPYGGLWRSGVDMTRSSLTHPATGLEPSRRGAARREELFDGLVALLLREGFSELTLDDIAARLRCSKRTLYRLARSKQQLVLAAVVHFLQQATSAVDA